MKFKSGCCKKWRKAFWIVLWGPPSVISKWKQLLLTGAIVTTISMPFLSFVQSLPYRGAMPPQMPLFKGVGTVVFGEELRGLKHVSVADFNDGRKSIRLQDDFASLWELKKWTDGHPLVPVYIEGFKLRDGIGRFWITYAATQDGRPLIDREKRQVSLDISREWFGVLLRWMYLYLVAPLWLISFNNIRKVRNSLGA